MTCLFVCLSIYSVCLLKACCFLLNSSLFIANSQFFLLCSKLDLQPHSRWLQCFASALSKTSEGKATTNQQTTKQQPLLPTGFQSGETASKRGSKTKCIQCIRRKNQEELKRFSGLQTGSSDVNQKQWNVHLGKKCQLCLWNTLWSFIY